jgi:predicted nuclease of predicted toxin-antitoxin system
MRRGVPRSVRLSLRPRDADIGRHELVARFLTKAGFHAVHWSDVGAKTAPDSELMQWALEHNHTMLTADLDFGAILASTQGNKPSVVQVRSELLSVHVLGSAVVRALRLAHQELRDGALVSVDIAQARLRILPLK